MNIFKNYMTYVAGVITLIVGGVFYDYHRAPVRELNNVRIMDITPYRITGGDLHLRPTEGKEVLFEGMEDPIRFSDDRIHREIKEGDLVRATFKDGHFTTVGLDIE